MALLNMLSAGAAVCASLGIAMTYISAKWPDPEPRYGSLIERQGAVVLLMFAGLCVVGVALVLTIAAGIVAVLA